MSVKGNYGKIFASYSQTNSEIVHAICAELQSHGLRIWIDQSEILPGDDFLERLNSGLQESKLFIAFVGAAYFQNGRYTSAEFGAAFHKARSADTWRIITVRLLPDIELPPLIAGRLFIDYTTPSETADRIVQCVARAEAWDGPVFQTEVRERPARPMPTDIGDIGDRDLEVVVSSFLDAVPRLLRSGGEFVSFEIVLPRRRRLKISVLRIMAENEGVTLTLRDLLEQIFIQRRYVAGFARQIDEGLLGKFEVATELALERAQAKLSNARSELRRELLDLVETVRIEQLTADATREK